MTTLHGFLNLDKSRGMTSHDAVAHVRRILHMKKIGHAGTLDPLATGVLILCVGSATRLSDYVMHAEKRYTARVHLGVTTTTYDSEGEVTSEQDAAHLTRADVERVLPQFTGEIDQMPPMYSAIKQGGKKLYDLARQGITVERETRRVTVYSLQFGEWLPPEFTLHVRCSAGTYIRSLAYDIGEALHVGAHMSGLLRTGSGRFILENSVTLEQLSTAEQPKSLLIPEREALADYPSVSLNDDAVGRLQNGRTIPQRTDQPLSDGMSAMGYNERGDLVAVLHAHDGHWKPHKVLSPHDHD